MEDNSDYSGSFMTLKSRPSLSSILACQRMSRNNDNFSYIKPGREPRVKRGRRRTKGGKRKRRTTGARGKRKTKGRRKRREDLSAAEREARKLKDTIMRFRNKYDRGKTLLEVATSLAARKHWTPSQARRRPTASSRRSTARMKAPSRQKRKRRTESRKERSDDRRRSLVPSGFLEPPKSKKPPKGKPRHQQLARPDQTGLPADRRPASSRRERDGRRPAASDHRNKYDLYYRMWEELIKKHKQRRGQLR